MRIRGIRWPFIYVLLLVISLTVIAHGAGPIYLHSDVATPSTLVVPDATAGATTDGSVDVTGGSSSSEGSTDSTQKVQDDASIQREFQNVYDQLKKLSSGSPGSASVSTMTVESVGPLTTMPANDSWYDIASVTISSGDWDMSVYAYLSANGATWTDSSVGISTTSGNTAVGMTLGTQNWVKVSAGNYGASASIPSARFTVAANTLVYFKAKASAGSGAPDVRGRILGRRFR